MSERLEKALDTLPDDGPIVPVNCGSCEERKRLEAEVERLRRTQDALKEWALDHKRLIEYVCESHPMPLIMQGWLAEARGEGDE